MPIGFFLYRADDDFVSYDTRDMKINARRRKKKKKKSGSYLFHKYSFAIFFFYIFVRELFHYYYSFASLPEFCLQTKLELLSGFRLEIDSAEENIDIELLSNWSVWMRGWKNGEKITSDHPRFHQSSVSSFHALWICFCFFPFSFFNIFYV